MRLRHGFAENPKRIKVNLHGSAQDLFADAVPVGGSHKDSSLLFVEHPSGAGSTGASRFARPSRSRSRKSKVIGTAVGALLAGGAAFAATNWVVGLASGSSANGQGASISNLVISDITSAPTETNKLYPSASSASPGSGDVTFTLQNPNPFPVTVTGVTIPAESLTSNDAVGYTTSALSSAIAGCGATTSTVTWTGASSSGTTAETFTSGTRGGETQVGAFAITANATITVTLTDDAAMDATAPLACAGTSSGTSPNLTYAGAYFVMPALTTIAATGGSYSGMPSITANGGSVTTGY